jgi:hypothetical protein
MIHGGFGFAAGANGDGDLVGRHLVFLFKTIGEASNDQVPNRAPCNPNRRRETIPPGPITPRKQDRKINELITSRQAIIYLRCSRLSQFQPKSTNPQGCRH